MASVQQTKAKALQREDTNVFEPSALQNPASQTEYENFGKNTDPKGISHKLEAPEPVYHTITENFKAEMKNVDPPAKDNFVSDEYTWEQKQLILLEQQQNELELKLMKMQRDIKKGAISLNLAP